MQLNMAFIGRCILFLSLLAYASSIHFSHMSFLVDQHHAPFFNPATLDFFQGAVLLAFIALATVVLPLNLKNVSSVFLVIIFSFLYMPIVVITMGNTVNLSLNQLVIVLIVSASFLILAVASRAFPSFGFSKDMFPVGRRLLGVLLGIWFFLLVVFVFEFYSVMRLSGLGEVYMQREVGQAKTLIEGYLQLYFGYFFSVVLFSFGVFYRNWLAVLVGLVGCVLLYSVTAERTVFMLPALVLCIYIVTSSSRNLDFWLSIFFFLCSFLFLLVSLFYKESEFFYQLGFYSLVRVVAIPGIFFEQYYDFFSSVGYTNYSHVSGLNLLFSPDSYFQADPLYPHLGKIVARDVHHIQSNSNASFLATDGAAAFGSLGVLLITFLLAFYLLMIDFLSRKWPLALSAPAIAPLAFILTNGSFFTVLLSFGGLLWLLILALTSRKIVFLGFSS